MLPDGVHLSFRIWREVLNRYEPLPLLDTRLAATLFQEYNNLVQEIQHPGYKDNLLKEHDSKW